MRDIRWGARIVAGFTDEHIRAAVAAARYTDPRAAEYLTRVLIERRDKLVQHWLRAVYRRRRRRRRRHRQRSLLRRRAWRAGSES